jgi:hypothetical protein
MYIYTHGHFTRDILILGHDSEKNDTFTDRMT